jgi:hypothetical protein
LAASLSTTSKPKVKSLQIEPAVKWNQAETAFLRVKYEQDEHNLPTRFFVKLRNEADPLSDIFPGEPRFYQDARNAEVPIAPCFAAIADGETGATCVLLEDLRPTHVAAQWPLPPSLDQCRAALASLAKVHAYWRQRGGSDLDAREKLLSRHVQEMLPKFIAMLGDRLPEDRAATLVAACGKTPALKSTFYASDKRITRVHGDAHFWNVLYPKNSSQSEALLIDWEDWRIDFAGTDLALLIAMHWYPDRRARHERDLLEHYLTHLNTYVEEPMKWNDLWNEYRLGLICNAAIPIFQQAVGNAHASWWSHLERWFLAFEDLNCEELL